MVTNGIQGVSQENIDEQWEVIGLYIAFAFKKRGETRTQRRKNENFGNYKIVRDINVKEWI
jgi:hypothetical protein